MKMLSFDEITQHTTIHPKTIIIPCAHDFESILASQKAFESGYIKGGIFIGKVQLIKDIAHKVGLDLSQFELIPCDNASESSNRAVQLLLSGACDILLKGHMDTKIYLEAIGKKLFSIIAETGILSQVVVVETKIYPKPFIVTDGAINIKPKLKQKAQIIKNAIHVAQKMGLKRPKVSIVCASENVDDLMQSTKHAQKLVDMKNNGEFGEAIVEGPYDIYISMSEEAARKKGAMGEIQGDADILVFHDINSANTIYKSFAFLDPETKIGAVVAGAKRPILLPSRADTYKTKIHSIILSSFLGSKHD